MGWLKKKVQSWLGINEEFLKDALRHEIKRQVEDNTDNQVRKAIKEAFNPESAARGFWDCADRERLNKHLSNTINKKVRLKTTEVVDNKINSEDFIKDIVERINNIQLKRK